jgi:adsorption protein B
MTMTAGAFPHWFAFLDGVAVFTLVLAALILLVSIDDLYIDALYWIRRLRRATTFKGKYRRVLAEALRSQPEKPIAIMVPAWHEDDVIAAMVENLASTLEYANYVVFVGTYPNDPATIAEVERMRRRYRQMQRVEVPHDGPTCKADCLNWIIQAMLAYEQRHGIEFAGVVMHDSEDVLHPLELTFFNYLLPRKDFIQIPVVSLERHYTEFVAGTYMDEFAEWHAKDLVVRESVSGVVPSAGVGTCFSRRAIVALCAETANQPFNTQSLTEDYDVGNRLGALGMKSIFALYNVQFRTVRRPWFGFGRAYQRAITMPLCVREFFPNRFRAAYRQKARWVVGISFQGWQQLGWHGSPATRLQLYRDRKALFTPFLAILGYGVFAIFLAYWLFGGEWFAMWRSTSTVFAQPWAQALIAVNFAVLVWRVTNRLYFVGRIYGPDHAALSIPRMVVNNFINFAATCRAWRLFLGHVLLGRRLVWDKTQHDFPSAEKLVAERKRIGELLRLWQAIDDTRLAQALDEQARTSAPLGQVLLARGWIDEETLADAVAYQGDLERTAIDVARLGDNTALVSSGLGRRLGVVIVGEAGGRPVIAAARRLSNTERAEIATALGAEAIVKIATESAIAQALAGLDDPNSNAAAA